MNPQLTIAYQHENGTLFCGDSIQWMATLPDASVDLIVADPPYNLKKAEWDTFESQTHYIRWSMLWIRQAVRVLKPTGSLYVMGFSEILADLQRPASRLFQSCRWLVWHYKNKANLRHDWGRSHESILLLRKTDRAIINIENIRIPYSQHTLKYPLHPQATTSQYGNGATAHTWMPDPKGAKPKDVIEVPTLCNGMPEKTQHPTQKPEELIRKFVLASSHRGDLVIDPFAGSGTTLVVAEQLGRKWQGCEINQTYNQWTIDRLQAVQPRSDQEWFWFDRKNVERRQRIRQSSM